MFHVLSHRAHRSLFLACCVVALSPDGDGGGGGGAPQKKEEEKPKKIELTQEEIDAKVESALAAERKKNADAAAAKKAEDDRKAEEENGNFKKLADDEKAAHEATRKELLRTKLEVSVRDYIAEKHKGYESSAKYIIPMVQVDDKAAPEDVTKAIKKACEQFVADNPRTAGNAPRATPSGLPRGSAPANKSGEEPADGDVAKNYARRVYTGPASMTNKQN